MLKTVLLVFPIRTTEYSENNLEENLVIQDPINIISSKTNQASSQRLLSPRSNVAESSTKSFPNLQAINHSFDTVLPEELENIMKVFWFPGLDVSLSKIYFLF